MFNAAIERGTGVRRLHITEEAQMKENVCVNCKYYESCGKPERYIKCMGYKEKERQQAEENTQLTFLSCNYFLEIAFFAFSAIFSGVNP